jgi:hypothetical protein
MRVWMMDVLVFGVMMMMMMMMMRGGAATAAAAVEGDGGDGVVRDGLTATCSSKHAFAAYARQGQKPSKGRGLTFCDTGGARISTCCGREQTDAVRMRVVHMQLNGFSETCRDAWAGVECSVCDATVGVAEGMPMCARTCDALYRACKDDFFAEDASQRLVPCRPSDTICSKLSEWLGDTKAKGEEMCRAAGYDPVEAGSARWCFDGSSSTKSSSSSSWSTKNSKSSKTSSSSSNNAGSNTRTQTLSATKVRVMRALGVADAERFDAAILAGASVGAVYVFHTRVFPRLLHLWHRRNGIDSRYAARRAAEARAKHSHYL